MYKQIIFVVVVLISSLCGTAWPGTMSWVGIIGDFEEASNWSPDSVPGAADIADFSMGFFTEVNASRGLQAITVSQSHTLNILNGSQLTLNGSAGEGSLEILDDRLEIRGGAVVANQGIVLTDAPGWPPAELGLQEGVNLTSSSTTVNGQEGVSSGISVLSGAQANLGVTTLTDATLIVNDDFVGIPATAVSTSATIDQAGPANTLALPPSVLLSSGGTWNVTGLTALATQRTGMISVDNGGTASLSDLDVGVAATSTARVSIGNYYFGGTRATLSGDHLRLAVDSPRVLMDVSQGGLAEFDDVTAGGQLNSIGDIEVWQYGSYFDNGQLVERPSELRVHAALVIGDLGSSLLTIDRGGEVHADSLVAAKRRGGGLADPPTGVVRVKGSHGSNPSLLNVTNNIDIGGRGSAALYVEEGAKLVADSLVITQQLGSQGTAGIRDPDTFVDVADYIKVGAAGFGDLLVENAAVVSTAKFRVANRNQNGDFSLVVGNGTALVRNFETLLQASQEVSVGGNGPGQLTVADGAVVESPQFVIGIDAPEDPSQTGKVTLDWAFMKAANVEIFETGTLEGNGDVANLGGPLHVLNRGTIRPGLGQLNVDGDYTQQAGGTFIAEIGGVNFGEQSRLNVADNALLDGTLEVRLVDASGGGNPFQPMLGDTFSFLQAGSISGTFSQQVLPSLSNNLAWELNYLPTSVTLSIVQAMLIGDFDADGDYSLADIDALTATIAAGSHAAAFDMTGDGLVDLADRDAWLATAGAAELPSGNAYLLADANLDGFVDGSDFNIWNANKYTSVAAWSHGDFTADGQVDASDFNAWNDHKYTSANGPAAVPEPAGGLLLCWGCLLWVWSRHRGARS